MTATTRNDAAKRLLEQALEESMSNGDDAKAYQLGKSALAAERRATVERIRRAARARWDERRGHLTLAGLYAILDEEAAR